MDLPTSDLEALNSIRHLIPNNKLTQIYPYIVDSSETAIEDQPYFKGNKYKLLISEDQADLTLTCGDRVWNVHQAILCPQSGFFRAACKEGFKVNQRNLMIRMLEKFQESQTKMISLVEDEPIDIWAMLLCVYVGFYSGLYHRTIDQDSNIHVSLGLSSYEDPHRILFGAVKLYTLGDKYDIPVMRKGACAFLERYLESAMENTKEDNEEHSPLDFATVYRVICNITPTNDKGLRISFARMCAKHIGDMVASESLNGLIGERVNWSRLLEEDGEMGLEILKCLAQQKQKAEEELNEMVTEQKAKKKLMWNRSVSRTSNHD
ncbi:hypothetical protein G7Y79_00029g063640 [Physcia stellaris]|nr:hypothetical protein G7Y79_00029g063640 [Physcia stellaris]